MKSSTYDKILFLGMALLLFLFTACSSDDAPTDEPEPSNGKVNVTLCLSAVSPNTDATRASWTRADYSDENATADEMMNTYLVLAVQNNEVKYSWSGTANKLEEATVADKAEMVAGTYDFYSFANLTDAQYKEIGVKDENGKIVTSLSNLGTTTTIKTEGNGTSVPTGGIPMSNKQSVTISNSTTQVNLWTVRLYAKIEVQVTNSTTEAMTLNSITLSDITDNGQSIYLLPNPLEDGTKTATGQKVNIPTNQTTTIKDYTYTCGESEKTLAASMTQAKSYTFYVNESNTPTNNDKLFMITLNLTTNSGKIEEKRYALITDNDNQNWNYIARNDYRVIPIKLSAYLLSLDIRDFTAIGISTTVVTGTENMFQCTFYKGNTHFHIIPTVTYNGTALTYSEETLGNSQWGFGSFTTTDTETDGLYASSTATTDNDGSLNGGVPVWDSSKGFLFGKTASSMTAGTTVNHTLTVKVKNNAGNTSELTYKLKMVAGSISN